ncbi:hypothetical protein B0I72DRAFT_132298 [Yarrowia lipolytica]|uniref:YALI0F20086p n=2 Tax=Yarrowia lipolytica TaxID=4952 RepID=Q6C115_YARLI|nr:YALI0F20086p [Yarrowia lipolytica CLIB122]KAE8173545.1 hypothetical protein BKA90DRAFT_135551 [Yarrowia lipolytica]RDW22943.1 hypothetical protein B0I71DRAFT_136774 [Yarrowia lipolytica]RDW35980.1 hypothetical protein B0I72DRAFT_132298 [Yarrowia lipolytica]RDW42235.1 hypothetical protein B0I73DRAFT_127184 [Yarrowia lipolytica]RDW49516.1 hypothetical protein B0I74DRAFT_131969 [Yarrowia lipolytica]|eukprot:XP_505647.1 YALI0F20086p [Yarrowia lipolytica CLIB122]
MVVPLPSKMAGMDLTGGQGQSVELHLRARPCLVAFERAMQQTGLVGTDPVILRYFAHFV